MTRLIIIITVPILAILFIFSMLMLMLGERTPAHLLAFHVTKPAERARRIYVLHLERGLRVNATVYSTGEYFIHVSPDGHWLIYRPDIEPNTRFALVNLHTWRTHLLPELPSSSSSVDIDWRPNSQQIWLTVYNRRNTNTRTFVYDLPYDALIESEAIPVFSSPIEHDQLMVGLPVAINPFGDPVWGLTLDDERIPRLYDYASDEPIISFEIGRDYEPVSLSPDDHFLAAVLNRNRRIDLYLVPAWEGEPTNLTNNSADESVPVWSLDGNYIAYTSQSEGGRISSTELRVYDVDADDVAFVLYFGAQAMIGNNPPAWLP